MTQSAYMILALCLTKVTQYMSATTANQKLNQLPDTISEVTGSVSYMDDFADGNYKQHQDQIRKRFTLMPQYVQVSGSEEVTNALLAHQQLDSPKESQKEVHSQSYNAKFVESPQL